MVQYSNDNPAFQSRVFEKMKIEVDESSYGLLVDQVNLNTGKTQIYRTQVRYNINTGQAYPKKLRGKYKYQQEKRIIRLRTY